jgi:hypothetical protein
MSARVEYYIEREDALIFWVHSVEKHFHERSAELQIPRLRSG